MQACVYAIEAYMCMQFKRVHVQRICIYLKSVHIQCQYSQVHKYVRTEKEHSLKSPEGGVVSLSELRNEEANCFARRAESLRHAGVFLCLYTRVTM